MKKRNHLIRIYSGTEVSLILLQGKLQEAGISSMIQNDFQSGIAAGFVGGIPSAVDLYIQESDLKKAVTVIHKFSSESVKAY